MTRASVLGALVAAGALSVAIGAYQQPQGPKVVEVDKLKDNLFMLKGGGGNTAVFVGANGVVVVDTKNPGWGQPILDKIKKLTPKPITTIINTHTHGDHVSGNVEFPATVDVVVQENTKANMEKMDIFKQNNGTGMAKRTFKDKMTVGKGADRDRPVLLRPRPHQRRRVRRLPGAARRCTPATSSRARTCRSSTRTTAAAPWTSATSLAEGARRHQERRHDHHRPLADDDDVAGSPGVRDNSTRSS